MSQFDPKFDLKIVVGHSDLHLIDCLIELGFNDMSTLVGHLVSSPRKGEKR